MSGERAADLREPDGPGPIVLIVEDEALVAITMEEVLIEAGFRVCGVADRPGTAIELARRHQPDLAVVDVRLANGGDGIALAEVLAAMGEIGILFATGNPAEVRTRARVGQACLSKPFEASGLIDALWAIQRGTEPATKIQGHFPLRLARTR
ncbi:MAG: hypothetical protein NVSMB18_05350 [Acetobacteraceae bacterium]